MSASEAPVAFLRDRPETEFSRILSRFLTAHPGLRAAVFLDIEGECVDYATRVEPYEAMVFSATLLNPTKTLIGAGKPGRAGAPIQWTLETEKMDALVRFVDEGLFLALWLEPGALSAKLLGGVDSVVELLCRESGLLTENSQPEALIVETRQAKGWGYAPRLVRSLGAPAGVLEVLGRWTEPGTRPDQEAVCFRVRTADLEWTLVHDPALQRWYRR